MRPRSGGAREMLRESSRETMTDRPSETPVQTPLPGSVTRATRRHPVLRAAMFVGGCLLILAGFLLGFVPFMPGFPLGLLGIGLLAASSTRVRHLLRNAVNRLPPRWRWRLRRFARKRAGEKNG